MNTLDLVEYLGDPTYELSFELNWKTADDLSVEKFRALKFNLCKQLDCQEFTNKSLKQGLIIKLESITR